jgi:hypothetical protein
MRGTIWIGCLVILLAGVAPAARADLSIFIQDTTVTPAGYGVVNVWLGSSSPTTDVFNNYSLELQITGGNFLQFANYNPNGPFQSDPQTQNFNYLSASNYIFNQNGQDSLNGLTATNAGGLVSNTGHQEFIVGDQSFSFSSYSPSSNNPGDTLLASLVLLYTGPSNSVGATYSVSVVSGSNTDFNQIDPNTSLPISGTDLTYSQDTSQTGYTGIATVSPASISTPEPSSLVIVSIALVFLACFQGVCCLRRRKVRVLLLDREV